MGSALSDIENGNETDLTRLSELRSVVFNLESKRFMSSHLNELDS